jgi:hypothetical protein
LFDSEVDGAPVGGADFFDDQNVANGLFTVVLDFGENPWAENKARWLEIRVRPGASIDPLTVLSPRQPLTAAPHSLSTRGIVVDSNGRVGIGTDDPLRTLDIYSDFTNAGIAATTTGPSGAVGTYLLLVNEDPAAAIATTFDMLETRPLRESAFVTIPMRSPSACPTELSACALPTAARWASGRTTPRFSFI